MPKIVEILAPSGTGKTTLYKDLQKKWAPGKSWVVYHDFRYKRKRKFPKDYITAVWRKAKGVGESVFSSDIQYQEKAATLPQNERLFYSKYSEFCDVAMNLIFRRNVSGFGGDDKRFMNTFFMFETIEHLQAVMNYPEDPRTCIMDEGLLSRLMHLNSPSFTDDDLTEYLEKMPLPYGVIYLKCDANVITDRIVERKERKTATIHENLSRSEILNSTIKTQQMMEKTLRIIQGKGVQVFYADGSLSKEHLGSQVYKAIKNKHFT